jgi:hypothetical protein
MNDLHQLARNLRIGVRVAFFLPTRQRDVDASWTQFALLVLVTLLSKLFWQMIVIGFPGQLSPWGLADALLFVPLVLLVSWSMAALAGRSGDTLTLVVAVLSSVLWLHVCVGIAWFVIHSATMRFISAWLEWILYYAAIAWLVAFYVVACARRFELSVPRAGLATVVAIAVLGYPLVYSGYDRKLWTKDYDEDGPRASRADHDAVAREDILYREPKLLADALAAVEPRREGRPNLYLVSVAGYADQNVFRREVDSVDALFAERFGTRGRSLRLVNNRTTASATPLATHTALAQALKHVGTLMDRDQDVLFLFLTSHGSKGGRFTLEFRPLRLNDLTAPELKQMLEDAGIRNRVIVVSSCYSGAFVDALKDDDTLIITASARDRNSFGCSNEADFTYFGKAYFDEALRASDSFIDAFDAAVPVIAEREKKENYDPSDPQRYVGANIAAKISAWREANARDRAKAQ